MSRRLLLVLAVLACANGSLFAVAEAAPSDERAETPSVLVAVVDSGVETAGLPRVASGVDLVAPGSGARDAYGHGTAVAAVIAAACQSCAVMPVRVLSDRGTAPWNRVAAGIVWAVDHGALVVNVSIAGPDGSAALRDAVAYAVARDVVVVAAAGNRGNTTPAYPAAYPGVVGVAARDGEGSLHDWSSRGSWVDLALPGCAPLPVHGRSLWSCGTSFAAPLATAAAAVLRSERPHATAAEVVAQLPARLHSLRAPTNAIRVDGQARVGSVVRASTARLGLGARLRWFRCTSVACERVSSGSAYRVRPADAGTSLVARLVTTSFGGLWVAAAPPLAVD